MDKNNALISLGSNIGNRRANIVRALKKIQEDPSLTVKKVSSLYESSPVGPKQRNFVNAACQIETNLTPQELLLTLQAIEAKMGRVRTSRQGPRNIDLDIIFYNRMKIKEKNLTIPHPRFDRRRFVLRPVREISPGMIPPGFRKTLAQLDSELTDPEQKVTLLPNLKNVQKKP